MNFSLLKWFSQSVSPIGASILKSLLYVYIYIYISCMVGNLMYEHHVEKEM
jgi:hypothetical protein